MATDHNLISGVHAMEYFQRSVPSSRWLSVSSQTGQGILPNANELRQIRQKDESQTDFRSPPPVDYE